VRDLLAQVLRDRVRYQVTDLLLGKRVEPEGDRPLGPPLHEIWPSKAEKQERCSREQSDVLDQVEKRLLSPLEVVEDAGERGVLLEQSAEGPGDLLGGGSLVRLAEQRAQRSGGRGIRGKGVELLDDLDHRPVRNPLPVGKAVAAHDVGTDPGQELGRQPRLAHAGIADDGDELTAFLVTRAPPGLSQQFELRHATDETTLVPALRRLVNGDEPVGRHRLGLPLQFQRIHRLGLDGFSNEL
jgi:hypothetical protein